MELHKSVRKIDRIILHCTATPEGREVSVADITRMHKEKGYATIGYHYVIGLDGEVHEGRRIDLVGAHCQGHNTGSIGVVYVGGMDKRMKNVKDTRTDAQKVALIELVHDLLEVYGLSIDCVRCHNQYSAKACPSFSRETFVAEYNEYYKEEE